MKGFTACFAFALVLVCACASFSGELEPGRRLPAWALDLKDPDPMVRQAAARGLGEAKDNTSVAMLAGVLAEDTDDTVKLAALGALIMIDDRSAMPAYIKALKDGNEKVRQSAAQALSGLWDNAAQAGLIETLKSDPSPRVRRSVAEALGNPGVMGRYSAHGWDSQEGTEGALIQALASDESYEVRAVAASVLGKFKDGKAMPALLAALEKDKNESVRASAAESLGQMENPQAVNALLNTLYFEKDDTVILSAFKALKYSSDPRLTEPAVAALRSANPRVRWQAIDALEGVRPMSAAGQLKSIADDPGESDGIRHKAKEALQLMGAD